MDKNMIKIDDLLRHRLSDAEEQERPAAWMQMSELLDKQMPATRAAVNWRRMFAYVAGIAILAAVSVGGYEMSQSLETSGGTVADANTSGNGAKAPATTGLAGSAINSLPDTRTEAQAAEQPAPPTDATNDAIVATTGNNNKPTNNSGNKNTRNSKNDAVSSTPAAQLVADNNKTQQSTTNNNVVNSSSDKTDVGSNNVIYPDPSGQQSTTNNKLANNNSDKTGQKDNKTQQLAKNNNIADNNKLSNNKIKPGANITNNTKPSNAAQLAETDGNSTANNTNALAANNKKAEPQDEIREIPIRKIERAERVGKNGIVSMDTIFNGEDVKKIRVPKEQEQLLAKNNKKDEELSSGTNMNPSAAAPSAKKEKSAEDAPMQKLGDHKVASKKMKNYNPQRFEEMVKNAKFRMGAVKFYPGLVFGANAAFNGNLGIHGGLAANITVGDRWAILTEIKYAFRFNNTKENVQDDYIDNVTKGVLNGQIVYRYDSMQHYYDFTDYKSLDIPLMVTYKADRLTYMLGASFQYNFKIKAAEVEQKYLLEQSSTTTSQVKFETDKTVLFSDFAPSMGISPMIGVGYQLSPAWRIDARLSKSLWNNTKSNGQKEIYKSLYNMPQFQLNISHRLSSNRNKPYRKAP